MNCFIFQATIDSLLNSKSYTSLLKSMAAGGEYMEDFRQYYYRESYLFDIVRPRFLSQGYLDAFDFFCIVIWKAERAKSRIARKLANANEDLDTAAKVVTWRISQQATTKERMRVLWNGGLELPMISAILTVLYPDDFTVYDQRVCGQLGKYQHLKDIRDFETLWTEYQNFKRDVQALAPTDLSLRDADRYLWGKSFREQLLNDIRLGFKRTIKG
jgi:hypothetical protein